MEKKRWLVLAGIAVAVLSLSALVAACGGGDDEDAGDGDGGEVATATEPADNGAEATEPAGDGAEATEPSDGGTGDGGVTVDVSQTEWAVDLSADSVSAGTVTFNLVNDGTILHNFKVAKTDLGSDDLPVDSSTFTVKEDELDILASSADLDVGETEELTVDLEAGNYVLFCNIPSHYEAGVHAAFTVE